jgi:hypothetical protein
MVGQRDGGSCKQGGAARFPGDAGGMEDVDKRVATANPLGADMMFKNTPLDSLGGKVPITAMTGQEPMGQLNPLVWHLDAEPTSLDEVWNLQGHEEIKNLMLTVHVAASLLRGP